MSNNHYNDSASEISHLSTREGYDRWASIYDDEDNPLVAVEQPVVDELLGDVAGLAIADVGCGTGRHALRLAEKKARVTGVDFSTEMLCGAREKPGAEAVTFLEHDLDAPLPFETASFDRVLSALVIEHIPELVPFFSDLRRICRSEGSIVITAMHPAMMLRGITARFTDPETGLDTRPQSHPHQISDIVMAAIRAGLTVSSIGEYAVDEALANRMERARKYLGWPLLLTLQLLPGA